MADRTNGAAPKVELRGVGLRYFGREGETEALQDISLSVAPGEFIAIIGQSGCGKSTLLSLISGILKPTEGAGAGGRRACHRADPQGRLHAAAGLPVRVAHHPRQRGARRGNPGRRHGQGARARGAASDALRPRPVPQPPAAAALRRHAAARGARAHALHRARRGAARRAVLGAGLADPHRARRRDHRNPAPRGQDRDPGHPRHRRGGQHGRAGRRAVAPAGAREVAARHPVCQADGGRPAPFAARNAPEFNGYFNTLWKELEVHVEG